MREALHFKDSNILKSILTAALLMVVSIFFFVPYITESYTIRSITEHTKNSIKQIQLTRAYYTNAVVGDVKSFAPELHFSYDHEGVNGVLPLPTTVIHDLSEIFSENTGVAYRLYSEYPFKNRADRILSPFQKEAIAYTKTHEEGIYTKRDTVEGQEVLRVAATDYMVEEACVNCHNSHPDRTWEAGKWKLGDSRGVIEAIVPIDYELGANNQLRNYIVFFTILIFSVILYYLMDILKKREHELTNVAAELETEVNTLSKLIDEYAIISQTDLNGRITYASQEFCRLSGFTRDELMGRSHKIVRHPDTPKSLFKEMWKTIQSGKLWEGDIKNRAKDGSCYYVHAKVFPVFNTGNEIVGYAAIRDDITQRILSQKALDQTRKLHNIVMDNQQSILVMTNYKEGVISFNKRFFEIFDFEDLAQFKVKHRCICELFIEREGYIAPDKELGKWIETVLANPEKLHKVLMKNRQGEVRIFSVLVKKVQIDDDLSYVSTLTDITETEHARELAESSERSKSEFMANMSHELRTPLNGITGFTELLRKTQLDTKQSKYLSIIQSSVSNLLKIINDVLDFSKIESGKLEPDNEEINPFIDLKESMELFSSLAHEKNITYAIHIDAKLSECLYIDKLRLTQILYNLVGNAIKFTPEGGEIVVHISLLETNTQQHTQSIRFSVRDSGIGIAEEKQEKIFDVFSQADASTTREYGGTGLGLSISASLVNILGGDLQLESEEGEGSLFYFDLSIQSCENASISLIQHVKNQPIVIIKSGNQDLSLVVQQLEQFKVAYKLVDISELNITTETIFILFNKEHFIELDQEHHRIISIYEDPIPQEYPENVYHINAFDACPSELYNAIVALDMIHIEGIDTIKENQLHLNVLVAEDNITNQILLEELLYNYGITPDFVENGAEAAAKAGEGYDIILMDINMPVMNGIDATHMIREAGNRIPIIALTANALEGDRERLLAEGMDDYLSKPIEIDKLEKLLETYAAKRTK
ncbi:MAG TPA: response regulator [Epsilonproteobacteria bacterium]|nr:response regulator [Campylobacterota bacterium]